MFCTCGDTIPTYAENKNQAVEKLKIFMNPEKLKRHISEKHWGESIPNDEEMDIYLRNMIQVVN